MGSLWLHVFNYIFANGTGTSIMVFYSQMFVTHS